MLKFCFIEEWKAAEKMKTEVWLLLEGLYDA